MCGGGGSGQRALEQEERDLLRMQTAVAQQGLLGRGEAMGGYRDFRQRGREMGSIANQERAAGRVFEDSTASFGNFQRMTDARMAGMGINPGDARFTRGRDTAGVGLAGQVGVGMDAARRGARQEGLQMEGAGLAGLAGFDPTGALNGMSATIGNAQRSGAIRDASTAQGYGQLGSAAMFGLMNADRIGRGWDTVRGWLPSGAESAGFDAVPNMADGGPVRSPNAYDSAMQQSTYQPPDTGPAPQAGPTVDPVTAMRAAKFAVDKVASSSLGYGATLPGVGMGSEQAAMLAQQTGAFGAEGLALTADAAATAAGAEAAGTAAASGLAGASTALGTAIPVLGLGLLAAGALGAFADGGAVPAGIGGRRHGGRAHNPAGGKVTGPGGPKDDMVPAQLSAGEFVMPVGAVKKFGLNRMEKMRRAGLKHEQKSNAR